MDWFPNGYRLPNESKLTAILYSGEHWQIWSSSNSGNVLVAEQWLVKRWILEGLIDELMVEPLRFDNRDLGYLVSSKSHCLAPIAHGLPKKDASLAEAFVVSVLETRKINTSVPIQDGIFIESISRILPTFAPTEIVSDDIVVGKWLARGLPISINSGRKFRSATAWLTDSQCERLIAKFGNNPPAPRELLAPAKEGNVVPQNTPRVGLKSNSPFKLAGRDYLSDFFQDHVIDVVENEERYAALGIPFPAPIILFGPPGTGKTFAVEKLTDYLGWPLYEISAESIGSPYIHETSKKVSQIFEKAIETSPSVVIIDEMDAYLAQRNSSEGKHSIEEVSEFLRLIPVARERKVLVIGMTNRIDAIDQAILRKGRFDHVIEVNVATILEIEELLKFALEKVPTSGSIDTRKIAESLEGRPLSDVSFVLREAARLAARSRSENVSSENLQNALSAVLRVDNKATQRGIGFL